MTEGTIRKVRAYIPSPFMAKTFYPGKTTALPAASGPIQHQSLAASSPNLKMLAQHLNLSPSTVSYVLNNVPGRSIPEVTRERVRSAAREFNYQPSLIARKLQGQRINTIGILLPELGEGYHSQVISGAGDFLIRQGFFYFTVHHRHRRELVQMYPDILQARGVEGILAIDTHLESAPILPTVLVGGHTDLVGVSNIILDSRLGAEQAIGHLYGLGHRDIVYMRGQLFSADTEWRWRETLAVSLEFGLKVEEKRIIRLEVDSHSPEIGYPGITKILKDGTSFTAVVCFNDVAAMGVIRALSDFGLRTPEDVSVIGYDDVQSAAYHVPSLTTIRQPLQKMGEIAAQTLLAKLSGTPTEPLLQVEPELVVRESTGPVNLARQKSVVAKLAP